MYVCMYAMNTCTCINVVLAHHSIQAYLLTLTHMHIHIVCIYIFYVYRYCMHIGIYVGILLASTRINRVKSRTHIDIYTHMYIICMYVSIIKVYNGSVIHTHIRREPKQ